ncbi:hypothetical protein KY314_03465 [Candidatus Woesearchaeota archaeon]|nr:hypothetical protein [Candidatus Woesearchaeota archaeon]
MPSREKIEELAEWLHNIYEKASKVRGWKTQESCRTTDFWNLPERNRLVMLDVAAEVLKRFNDG